MEILLIAKYVFSSFAFQNWENNNRMGFWDPFSQAWNKPEQTSIDPYKPLPWWWTIVTFWVSWN